MIICSKILVIIPAIQNRKREICEPYVWIYVRPNRGLKMKEINYWEQFMATGKIEDFLAYKNASRQEDEREREQSEEHFHAGDYRDYGDGFKG